MKSSLAHGIEPAGLEGHLVGLRPVAAWALGPLAMVSECVTVPGSAPQRSQQP